MGEQRAARSNSGAFPRVHRDKAAESSDFGIDPESAFRLREAQTVRMLFDRFLRAARNSTGLNLKTSADLNHLAPQLVAALEGLLYPELGTPSGFSLRAYESPIAQLHPLQHSEGWNNVEQDDVPELERPLDNANLADESATLAALTQLHNRLVESRHAFQSQLAAELTSVLNAHIRTMPHETQGDKQAIVTLVNEKMRELGLAIKCPKTGRPAILAADLRDGSSGASRFRLDVRDLNGRRARTYSSAHQPPELELMEAEPRREPLSTLAIQNRLKRGERER